MATNDSTSGPTAAPPAAASTPPSEEGRRLERRAAGLLLLLLALLVGSALYLLYARGAFEATQRLVLIADDSEGVAVGMDLTFSGFAIGRVSRITLGDDGSARIQVQVPRKDARWLRTSSVFTLSRGLVGGTAIHAYSGILADPPLPDGAERRVLAGDASAEIPRLVTAMKDLVANLTAMTARDAALAGTLAQLRTATEMLNAPGGAIGLLTGNPADAAKLRTTLDRSNALLNQVTGLVARTDGLVGRVDSAVNRVDGVIARADTQLLGPQGLVADSQATVVALRTLLSEARGTLQGVDKLLAEAQGVASNARVATADLGTLRAEVEASLRKVQQLVNELNRRWPLARDTELKLP